MRDDEARLQDIVEACTEIGRHIATDEDRFRSDPVLQAAAQRWLEIIGEAATHLSTELRESRPEIPWQDIIGMRTILAHGYFHIDHDVVWRAVTVDVPGLLRSLHPD